MTTAVAGRDSQAAATSARRLAVLLLTSHAVDPPWDGGDKNMARLLLEGATGVDYSYIGSHVDDAPWPQTHTASGIVVRPGGPSARDKLRLLRWLTLHPPNVDATHVLVTFQSPRIQHALLALPLLRRRPFIITCLSRANLPTRLIARSEAVVAISCQTQRMLRESGFENVHRIAPGVDLVRFRLEPGAGSAVASGRGPRLLFAGHHDQGGGLDAALTFVAQLRQRIPTARLMVATRARRGESPAWAHSDLRRRARLVGVEDAVDDLGTLSDMRPAYAGCSVVMFQPDALGMKMELPMTLLEALASSRPIVISPLSPLDEIDDGSAGVIVAGPNANDQALDQVEHILTDEGAAARAGTAARALAEREFCATRMAASYQELYQSLI